MMKVGKKEGGNRGWVLSSHSHCHRSSEFGVWLRECTHLMVQGRSLCPGRKAFCSVDIRMYHHHSFNNHTLGSWSFIQPGSPEILTQRGFKGLRHSSRKAQPIGIFFVRGWGGGMVKRKDILILMIMKACIMAKITIKP